MSAGGRRGGRGKGAERWIDATGAAPATPEEAQAAAEAEAFAASEAAYESYFEGGPEDLGPPPSLAQAREALADGTPAEDAARLWRAQFTDSPEGVAARVALAQGLWEAGAGEAALRLVMQARMRPDAAAFALALAITERAEPALADLAGRALGRRVAADPARLPALLALAEHPRAAARRAALVAALPFAQARHPGAAEAEARARLLRLCAAMARDGAPEVVQAVADWIAALGRSAPDLAREWLHGPGRALPGALRARLDARLPPRPPQEP